MSMRSKVKGLRYFFCTATPARPIHHEPPANLELSPAEMRKLKKMKQLELKLQKEKVRLSVSLLP